MINKMMRAVLICSCFYPNLAAAATLSANSASITAVFKAAQGGDIIQLSGRFGYTVLAGKSSAKPITLDATHVVFTDTLNLTDDDGLRVVGGHFGSSTAPTRHLKAIAVYRGSNISFD